MSLSARRAWIEIQRIAKPFREQFKSLSARRAWIEILDISIGWMYHTSLSARRAWIEISCAANCKQRSHVALRKESVDRNILCGQLPAAKPVALRKESVDRNGAVQIVVVIVYTSLSARRAWIEICRNWQKQSIHHVALRKESVDRNNR